MSKKGKTIRKLARDVVYSQNGKVYSSSFNPYMVNTSEHLLFERCYQKVYNQFWNMEAIFDEMKEVYGDPHEN